MNRRIGKLLAFMLVLVFVLSGCSMLKINKEADDQTVVAEYDGGKILKADAMAYYADVEAYYQSYGEELTDPATIKAVKEDLLTHMCEDAIVHDKAEALGLTNLSDDEKTDLTVEVTAAFNEAVDYYMVYFEEGSEEQNRQAAIDFLAQQNYTLDSELEYAIENAWQEKMQSEITKNVAATEEDIRAAYDSAVAADEEAYKNSAYDFEYAVTSGEMITWVPEGYRTVKHILLPFTEEQVTQLDDVAIELEDVRYQLEGSPEEGDLPKDVPAAATGEQGEEALTIQSDGATDADPADAAPADAAPTDAAPTDAAPADAAPVVADLEPADLPDEDFGDESDEPVLTREQLIAKEAELSTKLNALKAEFAATLQAKVDEVNQKIAQGVDFDKLIEEYGEDFGMQEEPGKSQGYYVSAQSEMWEAEFTKAAMALQKVGDVSAPVVGSSGVHIIRYLSDVQAGPVPMERVYESIAQTALTNAQEAHYEQTVEQWLTEAHVKTYVDRMQ